MPDAALSPLSHAPARSVWDPRSAGALLHECHAAHASYGTADEHAQAMIQLYSEWAREVAGLPAVAGRRSQTGTMRGAAATYTVEALVGEGRALQVGGAPWARHEEGDVYAPSGRDGSRPALHPPCPPCPATPCPASPPLPSSLPAL